MFKIRFHGLIVHADIQSNDVSVLVAANQHTPLLMAVDSDVIGTPTLLKRSSASGVSCYNLLGQVTMTNLPAGPVTRELFGVPKLSEIVSNYGAVRNEVINQIPNADFFAYVNIRGGLLHVDDFFQTQATFDGKWSVCVPRVVAYETTPYGSVTLTATQGGASGSSGSIVLQPTATIGIGNIENRIVTTPETPQQQYNYYRNLFVSSASILAPRATIACSHPSTNNDVGCLGNSNLGVECSNTQFP